MKLSAGQPRKYELVLEALKILKFLVEIINLSNGMTETNDQVDGRP